ncbi:trifunctional transcriptional regulator/proline dehydrogenase/L-glutamate gamma-semialdehyde dehydrogenase [Sphingomonas crocodyli]|uniref:Bifunctional protein PutA n=1 Tax=Sphingomonas crocodyli TaxID=1979270 RepID=A0A437M5U0_9SPHN|nr:trifunctional transcriptional regulator/proline dehydrogenase/L-glutamate gamma-semialdehyde dehydrogenase [Sphingomonas crocodyli]RVT92963.1 trifunctional transcriptional regulator/proline dehydrogenase/L-glutamate gamma-semialdehyde dehydrogenase [Sphingomonas crocodyli]
MMTRPPFAAFAPPVSAPSALRAAITAAYRRAEPECLVPLLEQATLDPDVVREAQRTARALISTLRGKRTGGGVEGLVQEFSLSSQEGVALMCLAEALLRIPDRATRDALIRDKVSGGDWASHLGGDRSLFVNAAAWGLCVTGKLLDSVSERGLAATLKRLIARTGEPVIRRAMDLAMRMMGEQFVKGETIEAALRRARSAEAKGFSHSYDMLGEAATTAADAARYFDDYESAIHAIGEASAGRGVYAGPGISIKLSALHPRYSRSQSDRVMRELLPRVKKLAEIARLYDIGFNIDAEEADRLELSLDLLESLAADPNLAGWDGLGFVVQAYGKRCPFVIDWIIDLARRSGRRIMVRLVKGAYWDAEIKRAQVDGLVDFPVYTRKVHTDVAYIACARKLLAAEREVFPQFATHNAQTLATIYHMAGPAFEIGRYEFQCLHGMGEPLYDEVVGAGHLGRPCRIYAPVGTHETLLAYLVRRLLENGANSSFVNRIGDPDVAIDDLIADPVMLVRSTQHAGRKHDQIALPADIYPDRRNSAGIDLSDETALAVLSQALFATATKRWQAAPTFTSSEKSQREYDIANPADRSDVVGTVVFALDSDVHEAQHRAVVAAATWRNVPIADRAAILERAADTLQAQMAIFIGLAIREAGKSAANAIAEVREAIDFLRYYASQARRVLGERSEPLGPVVCISPWNFPLAIFVGQIAAALAAGNSVLAKPAEETPLIAAEAVRLLHACGVPAEVLQLLPGDGSIGAALVGAPQTAGVMFTGSTEVARLIQAQLATRLSSSGKPIPLIAETGGQNAMIVDSSALAEQVVLDVIASAFDSAGQRCSALRILCLQEEVADRTLEMLKGALAELRIGRPDALAIDIGPVISSEAQTRLEHHIDALGQRGRKVEQFALPEEASLGHFVAPTIIELESIADLQEEVFGPVLHVVRFKRDTLADLIDAINATGYGLTFGLHTRLDETVEFVTSRVRAGNLYVNRNVIGAIVGVQPFGGRGLSGTGPKAGGPLYLSRLVQSPSMQHAHGHDAVDPALSAFSIWLTDKGLDADAAKARDYALASRLRQRSELPGPVGERNLYELHPRGQLLLKPQTQAGLFQQISATLASGCDAIVEGMELPADLPTIVTQRLTRTPQPVCAGVLVEGSSAQVLEVVRSVTTKYREIVPVHAASSAECRQPRAYPVDLLLEEVSISINTTAAGGNASLMAIG